MKILSDVFLKVTVTTSGAAREQKRMCALGTMLNAGATGTTWNLISQGPFRRDRQPRSAWATNYLICPSRNAKGSFVNRPQAEKCWRACGWNDALWPGPDARPKAVEEHHRHIDIGEKARTRRSLVVISGNLWRIAYLSRFAFGIGCQVQ